MVFFTCNNCGESLKKQSVEKHRRCGPNINVSCMDCQKDFRGNEYVAHIKCISEAEKYSGKDFVQRDSKNSGAKKQESWMDIVRSILDSSDYNLNQQTRKAFERIQSVDNVPRKKVKFQNFITNCIRMPTWQAQEIWEILEKELEKIKKNKEEAMAAAKLEKEIKPKKVEEQKTLKREATISNENDEPKQKKLKKDENITNGNLDEAFKQNGAENCSSETEFDWSVLLEKIVSKHTKEKGLSLDKLKKKVLKKYLNKLNLEALSEKEEKKFNKRFVKNLKKCPTIHVDGEIVKSF